MLQRLREVYGPRVRAIFLPAAPAYTRWPRIFQKKCEKVPQAHNELEYV